LEELSMRKFLLVVLIGMVLAMDVYGIVDEISKEKEIQDAKDEVATVVYEEWR
jgi:hypothetical protein